MLADIHMCVGSCLSSSLLNVDQQVNLPVQMEIMSEYLFIAKLPLKVPLVASGLTD